MFTSSIKQQMGTQTLSLNWSNQETNMVKEFQKLLSSGSFLDVTLACEGFRLKAHKMVLSASSTLFQDLFLENPCQHPIVILIDVEYRDLKALVQFMYKGKIDIKRDRLTKFLKTAEKLKIKGLSTVTDHRDITVPQQETEYRMPPPETTNEPNVNFDTDFEHSIPPEQDIDGGSSKRTDSNNCSGKYDEIVSIKVENECHVDESKELDPEYSADESRELDLVPSDNYWPSDYFEQENTQRKEQWNSNSAKIPLCYPCNLDPLSHTEHAYAKRNGERENSSELQQFENGKDLLPSACDGHLQDHLYTPPTSSGIEDIIESLKGHLSRKCQIDETECITPNTPPYAAATTSSDVNQNLKSIHCRRRRKTDTVFVCKVCGKSFQQKYHLVRHERIHSGERPYICVVCQKGFVQKGDLQMHLRIHSGEKPYVCNICGKKCRTSSDLTVHRKVHTGERPHCCELCKKRFIQKSDLIRHLRAHTGERPYSCTMCNRTFSRPRDMRMHAAKAHSEGTSTPVENSL